MNFTTKEFCRLTNVGRETLRHYERLGFLHPKINPENGYRSYDEWDSSIIADIKRYQALGFSLEEIRTILEAYDLNRMTESVASSIQFYQDQIRYLKVLLRKNKEELAILQRAPQLLGQYSVDEIPDLIYIAEDSLISAKSSSHIAMKHLDVFTPCLRIDASFQGDESIQDYSGWGLLANKASVKDLKLSDAHYLPAGPVYCTILDAGERGNITKALFEDFLCYVAGLTNNKAACIYANLLIRFHDETGSYHRYLYTFAPAQ